MDPLLIAIKLLPNLRQQGQSQLPLVISWSPSFPALSFVTFPADSSYYCDSGLMNSGLEIRIVKKLSKANSWHNDQAQSEYCFR